VVALANAEDLPAHGEAVTIRFPQEQQAQRGGDLGSQYPEFGGADGGPATQPGPAPQSDGNAGFAETGLAEARLADTRPAEPESVRNAEQEPRW
jgi:hypothetical protein